MDNTTLKGVASEENKKKILRFENTFNRFSNKKDDHECWIWSGCRNPKGYGVIRHINKNIFAHRASWFLKHGSFDNKLLVMHKVCDNPSCVNWNHLALGTQFDNMRDASQKKRIRYPIGEESRNAKLTYLQVLQIKNSLKNGEKLKDLAKQFKVHYCTIYEIKTNKSWKHVII